jgi:iron(III) transport system substrate-binding protein
MACAPASGAPSAAAPANPANAPAGAAAAGQTTPAAGVDWSAVVEAARREGVVECACPPRPDYARIIKEQFEAAVPGIRLETSPATLPDIWARVEKEQQVGQYLWDVYMFGPTIEMFALKDKGGFESFRDYMVGPDVGAESDWEGGYERAFLDREGRYVFAFWLNVTSDLSVNRDQLPDARLRTFDDLLSPDYRGKIVWQDPRGGGNGLSFLAAAYNFKGRDGIQRLLVDQQPLLVRGSGESAEQLVRGTRPVSLPSVSRDTLVQFEQAGVTLRLEDNPVADIPAVSNGGQAPAVFKNPPHPNATKVFVNWLLSQAAQDVLARELLQNSTRKGVPVYYPGRKPEPGVQYFHTQKEETMTTVVREAQRAARDLVP